MAENGYIGRQPNDSSVTIVREQYIAPGPTSAIEFIAGYEPGYVEVYRNGLRLLEGVDFSAGDGNNVYLDHPGIAGDSYEIIAYRVFNPIASITVNQNNAVNAEYAEYAEVAGIATNAQGLTGIPDIEVGNINSTDITAGIITATTGATFNGNVNFNDNANFADNRFLTFGSSQQGNIGFLTTTNSFDVRTPSGTQDLKLGSGTAVRITSENGLTDRAVFNSGGLKVTGIVSATDASKKILLSPNDSVNNDTKIQVISDNTQQFRGAALELINPFNGTQLVHLNDSTATAGKQYFAIEKTDDNGIYEQQLAIYSYDNEEWVFKTGSSNIEGLAINNGQVGIGTTVITDTLTVDGNIRSTGISSAVSFFGSGIGLTATVDAADGTYGSSTVSPQITVANGRITGITATLISGGGSGSGGGGTEIIIENNGIIVGTAGTINFGSGLSVSPITAGIVTVTSGSANPSSGTNVTISDNAPGSASVGDLWWESDTGRLKIRYQSNGIAQWVDASPPLSASLSSNAPATASSTGTAGDIRYDSNYVYICVATDTWKRAELTTW